MSTVRGVSPARPIAAALAALIALTACGGGGPPASLASAAAATASSTPTSTPSAGPSASSVAGAITFTVGTGSKAVVRVNEQLANRDLPSDAVLTANKVTGSFTLLPDGTFTPDSKIAVDITTLQSDNRSRDGIVQRSVLETSRFPGATFVPTRTDGLALPLSQNGAMTFTVVGQMTIHGVTKEVGFAVDCKKTGGEIQAVAHASPAFTFEEFGMTQPRVFTVISIKDEIRLEMDLAATERT